MEMVICYFPSKKKKKNSASHFFLAYIFPIGILWENELQSQEALWTT